MTRPIANPRVTLTLLVGLLCISFISAGQSLLGTWQLIKETTCLEDEMTAGNDSAQEMLNNMKSMSSPTAQIIKFKEKGQGEENTRILTKKRAANNKNFLYKFNGERLLILDKKSQTLSESYSVDKFSSDSLILSNTARACETKILIKIKDAKAN
jgi:hypothetical protein